MKKLAVVMLLILCASARAALFLTSDSPEYPHVTAAQRSAIARVLLDRGQYSRRDLWQAIDAAEHGRPLVLWQADQVRELQQTVARAAEAKAAKRQHQMQAAAERARVARQREAAVMAEAEATQKAAREVEEAHQQERAYRADYQNIQSPDDGRAFVAKYGAQYDPDHLAQGAVTRGYERAIKEAETCIKFSQAQIAHEREIAKMVGYENKVTLHQAAENVIVCRENLKRYTAEFAAFKGKPR